MFIQQKQLVLTIILLILSYFTTSVQAQEPTVTPSIISESPTPTISADIKAKLKALQDEIASKAGQLKLEMSKKLQNKIFVGTIISKETITFVVNNKKGTKNVEVKDYTEYLGKGKITYKNLAVNDFVIILGDIDDKNILIAKKIIKTTAVKAEEKQVVAGQVVSIQSKTVVIKLKDNQNLTFTVDSKTKIRTENEVITDIKPGDTLTAVLLKLKDDSFKARFVYSLPKDGSKKLTPTPTKVATPTAKPKKK